MRDIRPGHVAGDKNGVRIVRADGRIKHGPAAAGANHGEIARAYGESSIYDEHEEKKVTDNVPHLKLSFTFYIFA